MGIWWNKCDISGEKLTCRFLGAKSTFDKIYTKVNISVIFLSNGLGQFCNQDSLANNLLVVFLKSFVRSMNKKRPGPLDQ